MALYRNERIPPYEFVSKLKCVDTNLFVVFDSASMRWDILFKNTANGAAFHVYRVCKRDENHHDIGYEPLDDRVIEKLLRMDLARRNISPQEYKRRVNEATEAGQKAREEADKAVSDYIFKHEKKTLERAYEASKDIRWRL